MNQQYILNQLKDIAEEGPNHGLKTTDILIKINNTLSAMQKGIVKIAFVGAVSDGKTSTIAGLLGKVYPDMDIQMDESSDDIRVYEAEFLGNKIQVIDTPGLFGRKEREYNNEILKYSERTSKYISEANIIIYVCNARTPCPDSYAPTIKWMMRQLNKLPMSIFVINRIDEACDVTDSEDYNNVTRIKKDALIKRLRETIDLTTEEENKLNIFCTAADPDARGLDFWLKHSRYNELSHLNNLKSGIQSLTAVDKHSTILNAGAASVIKDSMQNLIQTVDYAIKPVKEAITESSEKCLDLTHDIERLKKELQNLQKDALSELDQYKLETISNVKCAGLETFEEILDKYIGISNGNIDFSVVLRNIRVKSENLINDACNLVIDENVNFERKFNDSNNHFMNLAKKGLDQIKNVKINKENVFAVRDLLFKNLKFKPYGAVKAANAINKWIPIVGVAIDGAIEFYQSKKEREKIKELEKIKADIIGVIGDIFRQVNEIIGSGNLGDNIDVYQKMVKTLEERTQELNILQDKVNHLYDYRERINLILSSDIEDVKYEEI